MAEFIDEAKVYLEAGHGGSGCVSFRREKFVPKGGPNGGDAGKGGDVVVVANRRLTTLLDFKYKRKYIAARGGHGMGNNRHGGNGHNLEIGVPVGTVIKDALTEDLIVDMVADGQKVLIAKGGRGGKGNAFFKSPTHQAPRFAQPGEKGEVRECMFELKLLADVGIIGLPNAGKSTLISRISAVKPKVADYPFTTLKPHLGVVRFKEHKSFVVADIPGLIVGAHEGRGLGIKFLKHIERTTILIHLIDIIPQSDRDPVKDYEDINRELYAFKPELVERPQVVALNKIDVTEVREKVQELLNFFESKGIKAFKISAVTGEGVDALVNYVGSRVIEKKDKDI